MAWYIRKIIICIIGIRMGSSFDSLPANLIKSFSKFSIDPVLLWKSLEKPELLTNFTRFWLTTSTN